MGNVTMRVKRLRRVAGCWYWRPSQSLRTKGYKNLSLGRDPIKAIAAARRLNARVDRELSGIKVPRYAPDSVAAIIRLYIEDERFTSLSENTHRTYLAVLHEIEREIGDTPITDIERPHLRKIYRQIKPRGEAIARLHMVLWLNLMEMAIEEGYRTENPARKMRLPKSGKRTRKWTGTEMATFRSAAVAAGRPSLALAVDLAFDLGQRLCDVLRLTWGQWSGTAFILKQSKTSEEVAVPILSSELRAQLNGMARDGVQIVLSELTRQPYNMPTFRAAFGKIRRLAGLPQDLQSRDTRRTALSEAGDGGATDDQIRSLGGHRSRESVAHYVHPSTEMASGAQKARQRLRTKVAKLPPKRPVSG